MTKIPHHQSFLAFACLLQEHFEYTDYSVAAHGSITMTTDEAADRAHRYYSQTNTYEGYSLAVEAKLRTFVSPKALALPDARLFIAEYVSAIEKLARFEKQNEGFEKFRGKPPSPYVDTKGSKDVLVFRPRRETQVNVIVGTYLSLPDDARTWARTADLLNRGIQGKEAGLNDGHVRNALFAGAKEAHRLFTTTLDAALWARKLWDWYAVEQIWQRSQSHFRSSCIDVAFLDNLRRTGLLEEWRLEAEEQALRKCVPTEKQRAAMLRTHISVLKSLQRKAA
jgi:hypothetical protein